MSHKIHMSGILTVKGLIISMSWLMQSESAEVKKARGIIVKKKNELALSVFPQGVCFPLEQ